jgi:hypothetical protein
MAVAEVTQTTSDASLNANYLMLNVDTTINGQVGGRADLEAAAMAMFPE